MLIKKNPKNPFKAWELFWQSKSNIVLILLFKIVFSSTVNAMSI